MVLDVLHAIIFLQSHIWIGSPVLAKLDHISSRLLLTWACILVSLMLMMMVLTVVTGMMVTMVVTVVTVVTVVMVTIVTVVTGMTCR